MALREKNPNIDCCPDNSDDGGLDRTLRKLRTSRKGNSRSTSVQQEKENVLPNPAKHSCLTAESRKVKSNDLSVYLTEKWVKESSEPPRFKDPPEIQRLQRSNISAPPTADHLTTGSPRNAHPKIPFVPQGEKVQGFKTATSQIRSLCAADRVEDGRAGKKPTHHRSNQLIRTGDTKLNVNLEHLGHTRNGAGIDENWPAKKHTLQILRNESEELNVQQLKHLGQTRHIVGKDGPRPYEYEQSRAHSGQYVRHTLDFSAALRHNLEDVASTSTDHETLKQAGNEGQKDNLEGSEKALKYFGNQSIRSLLAKHQGSAEHAEFKLRQMLCDFHEGLVESPPDGGCFNCVVHAYACRGDAGKAEDVLALMWHEFYRGNLPPDKRIFTTVMYAWQRSEKKLEAPEACEHLLSQMHHLSDNGVPECGPDTYTYTCILHCWANSGREDAAVRGETLFRAMIHRFEQGNQNLKPDTICYSNLINIFVNCGQRYHDAERVLWEMVEKHLSGLDSTAPSVRSFNTLLSVWSKSDDPKAPDHVQDILKRWKGLVKANKLDATPDEYSYALLLKSWTKSNRFNAIQKLLDSFQWIKELYAGGELPACPDVIKYTTVIGALNKVGDVNQSYALLVELIDEYVRCKNDKYRPDSRCFHIVLSAFSRSKRNLSVGRSAEQLLRRMWDLTKSDTTLQIRPNQWTYNTVIFCHQNCGNPQSAELLLKEMESLARAGQIDRGADIRTYRAVIQAWRFSSDSSKEYHIRRLKSEARARFKQDI